jgi:DNA-binding NtrC family response regulator
MTAERVLIVDDETSIRFGLRQFFEASGFAVEEAEDCAGAERVWKTWHPDVAVLDFSLPDGDGIELTRRLLAVDNSIPILILTAHGSIDLAVRAIKEGAEQFLTKPVELPALLMVVRRLLDLQRSRKRQAASQSKERRESVDIFSGASPAIRRLAEEAKKLAPSESPILIRGETGSGKGELANWLHRNGPRSKEAFVDLNCAGLTREFLETELFGHQRGAFTGAVTAKPGLLEVAHRGTLFLDEIGDLDFGLQPRLLKVLEEQRYRRLGDAHDRRVSVRLIAASHHDLTKLIEEQRFRADLYFRIGALPLVVPPLRDRREDIPTLADVLIRRFTGELGRPPMTLSDEGSAILTEYPWPGNVRELRNVLERAILLAEQSTIGAAELSFLRQPGVVESKTDGSLTLEELEIRHIKRVVEEEKGRVEEAARRLGVPRSSLYNKLKRYGIAIAKG